MQERDLMSRNHNIVLTSKADVEISDAYIYYESKKLKLGERFLKHLDKCFTSIDSNPLSYRVEFDDFRQAKIEKFPYVIIYKIEGNAIVVQSVFNTYQNPKKKL